MLHQGYLDFQEPELGRLLAIMKAKPTVVAINLDRPAVIPEIAAEAAGLLGLFGVSDEIVLEAVFGRFNPTGKLPFELPSSMEAVRNQHEDVPYDSKDPVFPFGFGLSYEDPAGGADDPASDGEADPV
jgi:beta-glucosidase